jgi:hypothetical protein
VAPARGGAEGWTRMLPDLRFFIGAVLATALLGVTVFGLAAAMHLSRQSKVAPLETSRLLAYTPDGGYRIVDVPARRFDNPFANIPADPNPVPMQQPLGPAAEQELAGGREKEGAPEPAAQSELAGQPEPATQPRLTAQPGLTAQPEPTAQPELAADPADAPPMQTAAAAQAESPPANDSDTVDERAVVDPPLPQDGDAVEAAPSPEPAPAPVTTAPVETVPPAPVVDIPMPPVRPEVEDVGSIQPTTDKVETRSDPPATEDAPAAAATTETPEPRAKRKRPVRRVVARRPTEQTMPINPFGFALYPAPAPASTVSTANRPAKGFWPPE